MYLGCIVRRAYQIKNRFVINSNLSEEVFLTILKLWCKGLTPKEAHEAVNRWAVRVHCRGASRQTVTRYFHAIGNELFQKVTVPLWENNVSSETSSERASEYLESAVRQQHELAHGKVRLRNEVMDFHLWKKRQEVWRKKLEGTGRSALHTRNESDQSSYIDLSLKDMVRRMRGIPLEHFHCYYARAHAIAVLQEMHPKEVPERLLFRLAREGLLRRPLDMRSGDFQHHLS